MYRRTPNELRNIFLGKMGLIPYRKGSDVPVQLGFSIYPQETVEEQRDKFEAEPGGDENAILTGLTIARLLSVSWT